MIVINRDKSEAITKEYIRKYREPKFQKLDVEFQIALEKGESTDEIVQKKQELRDMPKLAEGKNIEELKELLYGLE